MSDHITPQCRRRLQTSPLIENFGAGSGGDPATPTDKAGGSKSVSTQKDLWLVGNEIHLQTSTSAETPGPYVIELLAVDEGDDNGRIAMRGSQSVRITSGVPQGSGGPPVFNKASNGIDIFAGDGQDIYIGRGVPEQQVIQMSENMMVVDGGSGPLFLNSDAAITLPVAGGTSSIKLTPAGVVLKGPLIRIN
jgi:hypothetical protein